MLQNKYYSKWKSLDQFNDKTAIDSPNRLKMIMKAR